MGREVRKPWWRGWLDALRAYRHPRVLGMLFLGFSSGLPLALSETVKVPARLPEAVGAKVTLMVQLLAVLRELPQLLV